jgi:hypothetical protein
MPKKVDKDFIIYAEFWAATHTNSGVFIWAADPQKISVDSFLKSVFRRIVLILITVLVLVLMSTLPKLLFPL